MHEEIRIMATNCAVCERDARDAEQNLGMAIGLEGIAHPGRFLRVRLVAASA